MTDHRADGHDLHVSILGTRVLRTEDPGFLSTGAVYTEDVQDERLAGACYVHFVRSTVAHARPLHAGDVVVSQSTIEDIRRAGGMTMLTTVTQIRTVDGEHVCTARSALVERGA